jgi:hypothetical protein
MKLLFENWRELISEKKEATEKDVEGAARDLIDKEGGAIGRKMLKDPDELEPFLKKRDVELPEDFDLDSFIDEFIKGSEDIGVHDKKDIIAADDNEIKITKEELAEGIEIFLEAQEEMLDEKRKRKKKKKKKKKGKKDACYHKVRARYDVWPSAYASGALVKCRKKGAANWGTGGKKKKRKNESLSLEDIIREEIQNVLDEACWDSHKQVGMKPKGGRMVPDCVPKEGLSKEELEEKKKRKKKRKLTAKPSSETSLRDWFGRKGAKGKKGGWVDCNTCRKNKKTGRKTCSACGRSGKEKRAKYPSCRPTPAACGKRGKYGKKSKAGKKG